MSFNNSSTQAASLDTGDFIEKVKVVRILEELIVNAPDGAFPSAAQISLLNKAHPDLLSQLADAAWEGVVQVLDQGEISSQLEGTPMEVLPEANADGEFDQSDELARSNQAMVGHDHCALTKLAEFKNDEHLTPDTINRMPSHVKAHLALAARTYVHVKMRWLKVDIGALPQSDVQGSTVNLQLRNSHEAIEALCAGGNGEYLLSAKQFARLSAEDRSHIVDSVRARVAQFLQDEEIQLHIAKHAVGELIARDPIDLEVVRGDYDGIRWIFQNSLNAPVTQRLLEIMPASLIGRIGNEARFAIAHACDELQIEIEQYKHVDEDLSIAGEKRVVLGRPAQAGMGNGESYKKGKIAPDTDLPPNTVTLITDPSQLRGLDEVIGLERPISRLMPILYRIQHPELIDTPAENTLLVGPNGVGKSLLAEAFARKVLEMNEQEHDQAKHVKFAIVNLANMYYRYFGESNTNANTLMNFLAQQAPIIVFIDEIEASLNDPDKTQTHEESSRTQNTIFQCISGMQQLQGVTLIGATNRYDLMHKSALRAGRFGRKVFIPYPSTDELVQMFDLKRKVLKVDFKARPELVREILTCHTHGNCSSEDTFTGADIDMWVTILAEDHLVRKSEGEKQRPIHGTVLRESYRQLLEDRKGDCGINQN